jgi:hypothetical protein
MVFEDACHPPPPHLPVADEHHPVKLGIEQDAAVGGDLALVRLEVVEEGVVQGPQRHEQVAKLKQLAQ